MKKTILLLLVFSLLLMPTAYAREGTEPDCAAWFSVTGGETLWGHGAPEDTLGETDTGYVDLDTKDCWLKTGEAWVNCGSMSRAGLCLVCFTDPEELLLWVLVTEKDALLEEPAAEEIPGRRFEGWFAGGYGGAWDFAADPVTADLTLRALYTDTAPLAVPKITGNQLRPSYCPNEGQVAVLVIYYGCTDGPELDREALEDLCCGEYDRKNELRSAASYFYFNSCGKVELDFSFCYLDSGMSSAQLYQSMERAAERYAVDAYYEDLFRLALRESGLDPKDLDKDGDGYVDCVVFLSGEDPGKTVGDGLEYYVFGGGSMGTMVKDPDPDRPVMIQFIHMSASVLSRPLCAKVQATGGRTLIHELGHAFGLMDYYDTVGEEDGSFIDTLGIFDMQSNDMGDWNPYSRFLCGWVEPWLIEEGTGQLTLKLDPDHPLLIPGSKGWNGTPFDEYILIDVLAPRGANGFDWQSLADSRMVAQNNPKLQGGVRVYHADARLLRTRTDGSKVNYTPAYSYEEILDALETPYTRLDYAHVNSNGYPPQVEGESRFWHMLDWIPSDGSAKFRICHPLSWALITPACAKDLFGPGEVFSMERCADAFPEAPLLNNGGSLDWSVRVEAYDPETCTAIVTVSPVG